MSALELGKIRPAMQSLEFLAARLGKPASHFLEDEEQERRRKEREAVLARAAQLIAQGSAQQAIQELSSLDTEALATSDRLALKRMLGRAHVEAGQAVRAVSVLMESLRGYEILGDPEQVARTHGQLGGALITAMSYAEAEVHLSEALRATVSGLVRDPLFRVHTLYNVGLIHYERGSYKAALEQFERAADEGADIADPKWLASLYAAVGMSRREVGDYEGAISWLRKSETLFEAINNRARVAEIRFQTGRTLRAIGNKARAAEVLQQARVAAEAAGRRWLALQIETFLAMADFEDGQVDKAQTALERLLPEADSSEDARTRFVVRSKLAQVLTETDPKRAEALLRQTASIVELTSAKDDLADIYDQLSKVLARQGRSDEAVEYARRAYSTSRAAQKGGV